MALVASNNLEWTIGDRLRKARMAAGLDQAHMAAAVAVSRPTVSKWERGGSEPTGTQLKMWAKATGTTVAHLVGEDPTSLRKLDDRRLMSLPCDLDRRKRHVYDRPLPLFVTVT